MRRSISGSTTTTTLRHLQHRSTLLLHGSRTTGIDSMLRRKVSNGLLRATKSNSSLRATAQAQAAVVPPLPQTTANFATSAVKATTLKSAEKEWGKETVVTLKQELKKRGLPQTGNKSVLVQRLEQAAAKAKPQVESKATTTAPPPSSYVSKPSTSSGSTILSKASTISAPKAIPSSSKVMVSATAQFSTQAAAAPSAKQAPETPKSATPKTSKVPSKSSAPPPSSFKMQSASPRTFSTSSVLFAAPKKPAQSRSTPKSSDTTVSSDQVTSTGPNVVSQKSEAAKPTPPKAEEMTVAPGLPKTKATSDKGGLNVKMPDPTPEAKVEQVIPSTPDNFRSEAPAQSSQSSSPSGPKVMTVASASTHPAGGPSHAVHESSDSTTIESTEPADVTAAVKEASSSVSQAFSALGSMMPEVGAPKGDYFGGQGQDGEYKAPNRGLDDEEKRGLWILGGVVSLGWLIGGPKKDKKKKKGVNVPTDLAGDKAN